MFSDGPAILNWLSVLMEPPERGDLEIPALLDPREAYVAQIFSPGRFSTLAILKACNVSIVLSSRYSKPAMWVSSTVELCSFVVQAEMCRRSDFSIWSIWKFRDFYYMFDPFSPDVRTVELQHRLFPT